MASRAASGSEKLTKPCSAMIATSRTCPARSKRPRRSAGVASAGMWPTNTGKMSSSDGAGGAEEDVSGGGGGEEREDMTARLTLTQGAALEAREGESGEGAGLTRA